MFNWRRRGAARGNLMARSNRRTNLQRSDYLDREDYLRDLLRSGGPDLGDLDSLGCGSGFYSQVLISTWGSSLEEFDKAVAATLTLEQVNRPHIFVRKWRR
jgi:hypothetical protein